jgi:hypothetical protein
MSQRWDPAGFAFVGAGVGLIAVVAHEAYDIFSGDFEDVDPFIHIMAEFVVLSTGGAMLFAAIAEFRNWLQRR